MKIFADSEETAVTPSDLDSVLDLSIDDALRIALENTTGDKELSPEWYEKILAKLGEVEQNAFTMGLATEKIKVMPKNKQAKFNKAASTPSWPGAEKVYENLYRVLEYMGRNLGITDLRRTKRHKPVGITPDRQEMRDIIEALNRGDEEELKGIQMIMRDRFPEVFEKKGALALDISFNKVKDYFLDLYANKGFVSEDEFNEACGDLTTKVAGRVFDWFMEAGVPLKKNVVDFNSPYKRKVKKQVQHPKMETVVPKAALKKIAQKIAQRIDEEKRILEDTIRARQSQIPNWRDLLKKVQKALDFSELTDIWDKIKGTPAFTGRKVKKMATSIVSFLDEDSGSIFNVFVAKTQEQKIAGLESFERLSKDQGMLFPFNPPEHVSFHMGSVAFPIDIVFLMETPLGELKVAKIIHNASPGDSNTWSCEKTSYVLELNGGTCKENNIVCGSICRV